MSIDQPEAAATAALVEEIRTLARQRRAVILAHNYERPEVQDLADYVGDSLGLSREAARTDAEVIVFCGVHFMARRRPSCRPPRWCSCPISRGMLAGRYHQCRAVARMESRASRRCGRVLRQHDRRSEGGDRLLLHFGQRGRGGERDSCRPGDPVPARHVPRGARAPITGRTNIHVWMGECHVHAGMTRRTSGCSGRCIGREFLIHPECGCARASSRRSRGRCGSAVCISSPPRDDQATGREHGGHLHRRHEVAFSIACAGVSGQAVLRGQRAGIVRLHEGDHASQVRDALLHLQHHITVPRDIADRARLAIERMVSIGGGTPRQRPRAWTQANDTGPRSPTAHRRDGRAGFCRRGVGLPLTEAQTARLVKAALDEDHAANDITTLATVPRHAAPAPRSWRAKPVRSAASRWPSPPFASAMTRWRFVLTSRTGIASSRARRSSSSAAAHGAAGRRAHGAELPAAPVGCGIAHGEVRGRGARHARPHRRHRKTTPGWRRLESTRCAAAVAPITARRSPTRSREGQPSGRARRRRRRGGAARPRADASGTFVQIECDHLAQVRGSGCRGRRGAPRQHEPRDDARRRGAGGRPRAHRGVGRRAARDGARDRRDGVDRISVGHSPTRRLP